MSETEYWNYGTIYACETCLHSHANGIDLRYESMHGMDYDPETNPSPDPEPWNKFPMSDGWQYAMGIMGEDHADGCTEDDREEGCDCGKSEMGTSACEACGSTLHGRREPFVLRKV